MRLFILLSFNILSMFLLYSQVEQTVITFKAGEFTVSVLSEGGRQSNTDLLKGATKEQIKQYIPDGYFPLQTQIFLIRTPEHNILIDAGHGKNLFTNLNTLGLDESKIDVIFLTHMHGDHIGGLLHNGKIAFPNAELWIAKAEYEYWNNNGEKGSSQRTIFDTYRSKLHLFEPSEIEELPDVPELVKGICAIAAYGHTPGHTAFIIKSEDAKWIIWGDLTHAMPIQMPCPEVALSFDLDATKAIVSRKKLLEYIAKNNITSGGMHVPFPAVGTIKQLSSGYNFSPLCLCEGI